MKTIISKVKHQYRVVKAIIREKSKSKKRSPQWDNVRDEHVLNNPTCAACGSIKRIQVHHIQPYHLYPELELEPTNLITLCMDVEECHLLLGHGIISGCLIQIFYLTSNFLKCQLQMLN